MRELRRSMSACRAFLLARAPSVGLRRLSSPTPCRSAPLSIAWCATSVAASVLAVPQLGPSFTATGSSVDWRPHEVFSSPLPAKLRR